MSDFHLAACAEMLFTQRPMVERVRRIHELGFAVEIWSFHDKDLRALADTGATFSSMTGYLQGDLYDADGAAEVVRTAKIAIEAAKILGVTRLVVHAAELENGAAVNPRGSVEPSMFGAAVDGLRALGELGERSGVTFCLENLNTAVDHPGVPLGRAADTLALVEAVDHDHVKMMLDLYHAQIGEGNLVELVRRADAAIGEVQVADVPGRCEPGTGEVHYPAVARALREIGYTGTVGLEAYASGDPEAALDAFRSAFS